MSVKRWLVVLLSVLVIVLIVTVAPASAAKGGVKGKPDASSAEVSNHGQAQKEQAKPASSNGSGDKKSPNANNGKNGARPDQDGKGADKGLDNDDKQWDGNNGCGNDKLDPDSPFEDDNNGKCLGLRKGTPTPTPIPTTTTEEEPEPTPTPTPTPEDEDEPEEERLRICFHSQGNAVEVSDHNGDIQKFVVKDAGGAFEASVFAEDWHAVCWDAATSSVYYVLAWNQDEGHGGPLYRVETSKDASGEIHIFNPFVGTIEVGGVLVTRLNGPGSNLPAID